MRVKMSKPPPPPPTASAVGPCPTEIKIVGRPGFGSLPSTFAPPHHPSSSELTGCGYPGLLDRKNRLDMCPGGSRTLDFVHARQAPYPLGQALRSEAEIIFLFLIYIHICCGYSSEATCKGTSKQYPQHIFYGEVSKITLYLSPYTCLIWSTNI